jgi:hypothetical protein
MVSALKEPKQSVFLNNLHYFYGQTDGTYKFPNSADGDLLKQAKKELEALGAVCTAPGAPQNR